MQKLRLQEAPCLVTKGHRHRDFAEPGLETGLALGQQGSPRPGLTSWRTGVLHAHPQLSTSELTKT